MSEDEIIPLLEESLEHNLGDWGRTQYLIERIQKRQEIFQSDKKYITRMQEGVQKMRQRVLELEKIKRHRADEFCSVFN
ncbi:MAG: hypothetical protein HC944_02015 [Nanoarchaeota archaeon]|nr:hypothetical protein [Nanoarchaeota archaeon]